MIKYKVSINNNEPSHHVPVLLFICCLSLLSACASTDAVSNGSKQLSKSLVTEKIDFLDWKLVLPIDQNSDGKADNVSEKKLAGGYQHSDYFYPASDGGHVFKSSTIGTRTSISTRYVSSELREMLRRGNGKHKTRGVTANNWVLSSAPDENKANAGGVNGTLEGTLAINRVTEKGKKFLVGRVVVATISANKHEPMRLFYRKLPHNKNGSVYFVHEPTNAEDVTIELIGSKDSSIGEISDGIPLNEKWSYRVDIDGEILSVRIIRPEKIDVVRTLDISENGYDTKKQFMYFKAGLNVHDNSGIEGEYAQLTYYRLKNSHQ